MKNVVWFEDMEQAERYARVMSMAVEDCIFAVGDTWMTNGYWVASEMDGEYDHFDEIYSRFYEGERMGA